MRVGWNTKRIGEVATTQYGLSEPMNEEGKGFKIFRMGEVQDGRLIDTGRMKCADISPETFAQYKLRRGDVLFNRTNSFELVGKTGMFALDGNYCFASYLVRINLDRRILLPEFLNYLMNSNAFQERIKTKASKSINQANINATILSNELITFPESLSEQKRIVAILDEAFEGLDRAAANAKKNLANARELFDSHLNGIFTKKGPDWVERTFAEICSINSALVDPRKPEFIDLPHVGAGNIISKTGALVEIQTAREEGLKSGKFLFDETMVLYSKIRPYLMKSCRPDFRGLCSADVYPLSPNRKYLNRDFLFHILMSKNFTDFAIGGSDRAGMPKVNRDHLFRYRISLPNVDAQVRITSQLDAILEGAESLSEIYGRKLVGLTNLRQSILQKAFAGELPERMDIAA